MENTQMNATHYARVHDLTRMIYSVAPNQRLGAMKDILDYIPQDAGLRRILSDPILHKEPPKADGKMNVAKAASEYTKKFFGVSITTYMKRVVAGTVNEAFIPEPSFAPMVTTDEPEIHLKRNESEFLSQLRDTRNLTRSLGEVSSIPEAA